MHQPRTELQRKANAFDLQLFNLMHQAEALADKNGINTRIGKQWAEHARKLSALRTLARSQMHPADIEETKGS